MLAPLSLATALVAAPPPSAPRAGPVSLTLHLHVGARDLASTSGSGGALAVSGLILLRFDPGRFLEPPPLPPPAGSAEAMRAWRCDGLPDDVAGAIASRAVSARRDALRCGR